MPALDSYLDPRCTSATLDSCIARRAILEALRGELAGFHGTVLDIGCGYMPYRSLVLAPPSRATRYIGLDLEGGPYHNSPDLFWDGRSIPMSDAEVDGALATEVLEHCPDPEAVLREACRVLKPGGLLFITVPFLWPLHDVPHDEYRYTPFALDRHLAAAGFCDVQLKALGGWDASLAGMLALWVRGRPMPGRLRQLLSLFAVPVVRSLVRLDRPPAAFVENTMITGLAGTAR